MRERMLRAEYIFMHKRAPCWE